jgi:cell division protein FtsQ
VADWAGRKIGRIAAAVGVLGVILTAPLWLRTVGFFEVRQVEVLGARYLEAGTIVTSLEIGDGFNLYSPMGVLEQRVSGVDGVDAVEIERRLPGTLRVAIVERTPVALVPGQDGMVALDELARSLPYDPARVHMDLPVVATADAALTGTIALVRGLDAQMFAEVIGARRNEDDNIVLEFAAQSVIFESTPSIGDILKITAVRRHLEGTADTYDWLDARFDGIVVARRPQV